MRTIKRSSQSGSVLALLLVVTAVICVIAYVVMGLVSSVMNNLGDEDTQLEAQMLAADIREYAKYLLAYEKIFFVDHPLRMDGTRKSLMTQLWGQNFAYYDMNKSVNMINTCGGYSADAEFIGNLRLGNERVFCPFYLRQPDFVGRVLEDMLLDRWANPTRKATVLASNSPVGSDMADVFIREVGGNTLPDGWYRLSLDFSGEKRGSFADMHDDYWYERPENTIPMYVGQRLFDLSRSPDSPLQVKARVFVDIFTDSMGFAGQMTERFIKLTATVTFRKKGVIGDIERTFVDSESFVIRIPTIKDFALFMLYPTTSVGTSTSRWSESMLLHPSSSVDGRVYFNGDIDVPLENLPTFMEPVFISGRLLQAVPPEKIGLFRQKFRRGLISNLSAPRYMLDGKCPRSDGSAIEILNGTSFLCRSRSETGEVGDFTIHNYIDRLFTGGCASHMATITGAGILTYKPELAPIRSTPSSVNGSLNENCNSPLPNVNVRTLSVGARYLTVNSKFAHIVSPVAMMDIQESGASIYGSIVGGFIRAQGGAKFVALSAMRQGLPGIGSAATLSQRSDEANKIADGVSLPLPNLPFIQMAKDGFK